MIHLNSNILCAIDIETTGIKPGLHDIVQICVMPLDFHLKPHPEMLPFDMTLRPDRIHMIDVEDVKISKPRLANLVLTGTDPFIAADLFDDWFDKLLMPYGKKIMPLTHNWAKVRPFLEDWLGTENFDFRFSPDSRELSAIGLYLNDRANVELEQFPFPKVNFRYMAVTLKMPLGEREHNSILNCATLAAMYNKLIYFQNGVL